MPPLSLLIKPASSLCNLRCEYCFYHSISDIREVKSYGIMNNDCVESIVKKAFEYGSESISFAFQGGEPTIAGLDYFINFIGTVKKYSRDNVSVSYSLQTNGTLINTDWANFFKLNNFLIGISLDGMMKVNDKARKDQYGAGSFIRIMDTIDLFDKIGVEYNVLCVVSKYLVENIEKVYSFYSKKKFKHIQFIPCLDPLDEEPGSKNYSLVPSDYGEFLIKLFDLWHKDLVNGKYVSIRHIDNYIRIIHGLPPEQCGMKGHCSSYFVIEAGGQVFPCDFYVLDKWNLGNIIEDDFRGLLNNQVAKNFINESLIVHENCKKCKWGSICKGGCKRHREPVGENGGSLNYFCSSYKKFFEHSYTKMKNMSFSS